MSKHILQMVRVMRDYLQLPLSAKIECLKDHLGLPQRDPGTEQTIAESVAWLGRAQDRSASQDGGVARHFSLQTGWSVSYPETTGYIVPTLLTYAKLKGDEIVRQRAKRMLDWLVSIQLPDGSFQGGLITATPITGVTFNTGQILLGLASGVCEFGEAYRQPMYRAADWLMATQDPDGCWRRYPTPFAKPGEKAYETHVAWGLLEAARLAPERPYADAALANVNWALSLQRENGWFEKCCLTDPSQPLTHTLGYVLRGILEAYRFTNDVALLQAGQKTAEGLLTALHPDGFLPGRLQQNWQSRTRWACLTGSVQIAYCWLMLYCYTNNTLYRDAAYAANQYVRRTIRVTGAPSVRGAIKGSFPVSGEYGSYEYLNWACKFFIDSHMLEQAIRTESSCFFPLMVDCSISNVENCLA